MQCLRTETGSEAIENCICIHADGLISLTNFIFSVIISATLGVALYMIRKSLNSKISVDWRESDLKFDKTTLYVLLLILVINNCVCIT